MKLSESDVNKRVKTKNGMIGEIVKYQFIKPHYHCYTVEFIHQQFKGIEPHSSRIILNEQAKPMLDNSQSQGFEVVEFVD